MAGRALADLQCDRGCEATVDHCQGTPAHALRTPYARHAHRSSRGPMRVRFAVQAAAWWQAAVHMLGPGSSTLVGRADDDTFVVLPRLHAHLQQLGCVRHLCYGPMAYVGYNPATYAKCGWGWAGDGLLLAHLQPATPCSRLLSLASPRCPPTAPRCPPLPPPTAPRCPPTAPHCPRAAPCSPLQPPPPPLYRQLLQVPVRGHGGAAALPLPFRHAAGAQRQRQQRQRQRQRQHTP